MCWTACKRGSRRGGMMHMRLCPDKIRAVTVGRWLSGRPSHWGLDDGAATQGRERSPLTEDSARTLGLLYKFFFFFFPSPRKCTLRPLVLSLHPSISMHAKAEYEQPCLQHLFEVCPIIERCNFKCLQVVGEGGRGGEGASRHLGRWTDESGAGLLLLEKGHV